MSRRERIEGQGELAVDVPAWERGANAEQLEVIRHEDGPLQTLAQAGSGKTFSLVNRIARLVKYKGVDPERILAVTFSRKGAGEMDKRLKALGVPACVQTWHALCYRILREDMTEWASWTLDEKDKAKTLVKQAAGYKHEDWKGADITKIRSFIGRCKANLFAADSEEAAALARKIFGGFSNRAVRVFSISQDLIERAALLTFDDMLVFAHRWLSEEENRASWAGRFDYVLTDEAQDNSRVQVALQEMLARDHRNLMVVGDSMQAIFSFRGSSPEYLTEFAKEWPATKRVAMCRNYRSGAAIVRVANEVARLGDFRLPEDMIAARSGIGDGKVEIVAANTLDDEAGEVTSFVKAHVEGGGKLSDVCVLYRLNAQSRALEEALLKAQIPHIIVGGTNFYERKEVKDLLAYLRLATGRDKDGDAVKRCINAPFRFLGAQFVEKVADERNADPEASWENCVLRVCNRERIQDRQKRSAFEWVRILESIREKVSPPVLSGKEMIYEVKPDSPNQVLTWLVDRTDYVRWLEKEEGEESIESSHGANVRELLRVASSFSTVEEFLSFVEKQIADSAKQKKSVRGEAVTLMTIHRSKGLQFPVVWVVGCNETILPHARGDIEEERRLFYVAVTRAERHLVCSHVEEMATRAGLKQVEPSQFLAAFPLKAVPPAPGPEERKETHCMRDPGPIGCCAGPGRCSCECNTCFCSLCGENPCDCPPGTFDDEPQVAAPAPGPEVASERNSRLDWLSKGPPIPKMFVASLDENCGECLRCGKELYRCECELTSVERSLVEGSAQ
jgi:DNA helicase-2/ATP-dependent DNA helicase PcrA